MKTYHLYDQASGEYTGEWIAQESPQEPGIYLAPTYSTDIAPPQVAAGQVAVFSAGAWSVVAIPAPPAPPAPTAAELLAASNAAAKNTLQQIDIASVRALREWFVTQAAAPQVIKDHETAAIAARALIK